jgi:hypothetical protein
VRGLELGGEAYEELRRPQVLRREVAAHGDGEGPERLFRRVPSGRMTSSLI